MISTNRLGCISVLGLDIEKMNDLRRLIFVAALGLVLAACNPSGDGSDTDGDETGPEERVQIANFAFSPASLTVPVGTSVTWENTDGVAHTTTSDDDLWGSGPLDTGDEFSAVFNDAGEFTFFCSIHPSMTGTITVEG